MAFHLAGRSRTSMDLVYRLSLEESDNSRRTLYHRRMPKAMVAEAKYSVCHCTQQLVLASSPELPRRAHVTLMFYNNKL